jgi:hemerythrin-like domain-containing protein
MTENISLYKNGSMAALNEIYRNMKGYTELLRNHISKENNILFKMADNVLSESEQKSLLLRFDTLDHNRPAGSKAADYESRIKTLATFYNV